MKKLFALPLLLLIACSTLAQKNEPVRLIWKIDKDKPLVYETIMELLESKYEEESIFDHFPEDDTSGQADTKRMMELMEKAMRETKRKTRLINKGNNVIDLEMYVSDDKGDKLTQEDVWSLDSNDVDSTEIMERMINSMGSLNSGIQLRGSVYADGGIHSFWVKSNQKNMIAMFFELPQKAVSVGDTWEIDINYIGNDQNFKCDSAYKKNEVKLVEIKNNDIAVIEYNIIEYVKGEFEVMDFLKMMDFEGTKEDDITIMDFKFTVTAEFSISKGKWISYEGLVDYNGSGVIGGSSKTRFALIEK